MNESQVFANALKFAAPAERAAYLDRACAGDPELRADLEALLQAHDTDPGFLEHPVDPFGGTWEDGQAPSTPNDPRAAGMAPAEGPGVVLAGRYKLLQQIGEGGMGTVFMAEQSQPVQRKVAIKVIKAGMDSRQVVARFEAERQALALMDHVNIARVLDGGATEAGRPYFVMELVHGVPITKYCDDNRLTPRERLELFVPVCQAIQHAHQKGIIHRDVKPSNVMVTLYDGRPVAKVIDFGVAKATEQRLTEQTLFTQYGTMVGTLEYMSPEQAEMSALGVDTRSDVFSLGVLLYELLTGNTPLTHKRMKEAAYTEILRLIKEEEPQKPSTRLSDSGAALASISAQRHMEPAKLTKLVRGELDWIVMKCLEKDRNRRYESASAFAADVQRYLADEPVQACPPSAWYLCRKFARRNKAGLAMVGLVLFFIVILGGIVGWGMRDGAAREQAIAQETARKLGLTEQGIRQALDRGTTSRAELHVLLKKPGGVQQLLNQPARWELLIKMVQGELAQARQLAVRAEGSLGTEWNQAMDQFEQQLTSDQTDYDLAQRLETIRLDSATLVEGGFAVRLAADEYAKAFAGFGVLDDDPETAAARLRLSPIKDQLVAALDHWAWIAFDLRNRVRMEQLLAVARQTTPDPAWGDRLRQPKVWDDHEALARLVAEVPAAALSPHLLEIIGTLLRDVNNPLKVPWLRKAQAEHPADFWLNYDLAVACRKTNPAEAAGYCRVALAVRPGNISAYNSLGNCLLDLNKLDEAMAAYHKAIDISPKYRNAHYSLGLALMNQEKLDEAIACFREAIVIDPNYANAHCCLGLALKNQNKLDEAIAAYHMAIAIDPKHALAHYNLGNVLYGQKKLDDAVACYREAIAIDPKNGHAHYSLGNCLRDQNELDEAIACHRRSVALAPNSTMAKDGLSGSLGKKGWELANHPDPKLRDPKRAVELAAEAVELAPQSTWPWRRLGGAQYRAGNWKASIEALEKSCHLHKGGTGDAFQWLFLAMAHWQLGDQAEARMWYDKAIPFEQVWPEELRRLRAEAEELLGVKEKQK